MRVLLLTAALASTALSGLLAQASGREGQSGADLYKGACIACHGPDGRGMPRASSASTLRSRISPTAASPRPSPMPTGWPSCTMAGRRARSTAGCRRSASALTEDELERTLDYIRSFCTNPSWPRGDLNLPRALVTEKAFPENEAVLTTDGRHGRVGSFGNELLYEQRLGARSQYEVVVPLAANRKASGAWQRGLGDVAFAVKHVLFHSLDRGNIFSVGGEVVLPTGKESARARQGRHDLRAVRRLRPDPAARRIPPGSGRVGTADERDARRPTRRSGARRSARASPQGRFGRSWSPMVELLAARELETARPVALGPGAADAGHAQPAAAHHDQRGRADSRSTSADGRSTQVITYFLWDWFDGGLLDGWR